MQQGSFPLHLFGKFCTRCHRPHEPSDAHVHDDGVVVEWVMTCPGCKMGDVRRTPKFWDMATRPDAGLVTCVLGALSASC